MGRGAVRALGPGSALAFAFALGAIVGSFLNVVIYRVPLGRSIVRPGSACPHCGAAIPGWANVPLLSYLALRGRCFACREGISPRYPAVEALTGALFAAAWLWGESGRVGLDWALLAALVAVTFIDFDHHIIPNAITLPGIALGLAAALLWPPAGWEPLRFALSAAAGVILGGGMLWGIAALYEWRTGQIGLGLGDVKLVAMLGAWLGLEAVLGVIVLGSLLGIAHALVLIALRGGGRKTKIPFGPALAVAGALHVLDPGLLAGWFGAAGAGG
jgi:leader peptidase (prepilin peptidase) / N-methyltransferase